MGNKLNVAILGGGNSSEKEISLKGVKQIAQWLNKERYNAFPIIVEGTHLTLKHPNLGDIPVSWDSFTAKASDETIAFHCAIIGIHGRPGETGHLQGYLEMMGIPYTTGGVMSTALTFDKEATKQMIRDLNINLCKMVRVTKGQHVDTREVVKYLGLPVFVKPNESGSSYGITKVKQIDGILPALQLAYTESLEALIEEFIPGRELTCGLVKTRDKSIIFPITEVIPKNEYFDYGAKYKNQSDEVTPAHISNQLSDRIQNISSEIYDRLKCRGIVRIDYILNNDKLYFLEVNTVPGMSEASIIPQQAAAMGLSMTDIFSLVIEDAMQRG